MPIELREILLWLRTSGVRLLLITGASILLVRLLSSLVNRILRLMANGSGATISEAEKRARTMAGLLRTVGTAFIIVVAALMALREIGLDITPLLAGAGVAGLAIGFGAQSLIKDAIAGFFILMEDQFHVGDVIQVAGVSGQVERMNLRTTIVRDLRHRPFRSQRRNQGGEQSDQGVVSGGPRGRDWLSGRLGPDPGRPGRGGWRVGGRRRLRADDPGAAAGPWAWNR